MIEQARPGLRVKVLREHSPYFGGMFGTVLGKDPTRIGYVLVQLEEGEKTGVFPFAPHELTELELERKNGFG